MKHHKTAEVARLPRGLVLVCVCAVMTALAFLTYVPPREAPRRLALATATAAAVVKAAPATVIEAPLRVVYRNSVVPGGVHSAGEVAGIIARDPVVAAHYANIDVRAVRALRVEKARMVHVSYRIGKQVYWTRNKVRLALGETLLSDGQHLIRARCGNRIADAAEGPVLQNEPAAEVLDTAFVSADDLIDPEVHPTLLQPGTGQAAPLVAADASRAAGALAGMHVFQPGAAGDWRQTIGDAGAHLGVQPGGLPASGITPSTTSAAPAMVAAHGAPALLVNAVFTSDPQPGKVMPASAPGEGSGAPAADDPSRAPTADAPALGASGAAAAPGTEAAVDNLAAPFVAPDLDGDLAKLAALSPASVAKASANIPEPSGMLLSMAALIGLWWARRRRVLT